MKDLFLNQNLNTREVITVDTYGRFHKCFKLNNFNYRVINTLTEDNEVTDLLAFNVYTNIEMKEI